MGEMQIPGPHIRPIKSEMGVRPYNLCLNKASGDSYSLRLFYAVPFKELQLSQFLIMETVSSWP